LLTVLVVASPACGDDGGATTAVDAAAAIDADPNAPDAAPGAADAAPNAPDASPSNSIACGETTCVGGDVCCNEQGMGGLSQTCTAANMCMGAPSTCDGPEDCNGAACCASQAGAQCQSGGMCQLALCHDATDCTGMGQMCCPGLGGVNVCSPFCL
jgi:hypothetical protein